MINKFSPAMLRLTQFSLGGFSAPCFSQFCACMAFTFVGYKLIYTYIIICICALYFEFENGAVFHKYIVKI